MPGRRRQSGSALLAALLVIAVLAVVTVATLQLAQISKQSSVADSRRLSQTSCVEAARQYLVSRLRLFGLDPTTIQLDQSIAIDSAATNNTRRLYSGHVRDPDGGVLPPSVAVISSVMALPPSVVSNNNPKSRDISNVIAQPTLGGKAYRVVVACSDPLAGDMELEFTFKYGL
jgi:type II secretory pathway pseudopilin PulG